MPWIQSQDQYDALWCSGSRVKVNMTLCDVLDPESRSIWRFVMPWIQSQDQYDALWCPGSRVKVNMMLCDVLDPESRSIWRFVMPWIQSQGQYDALWCSGSRVKINMTLCDALDPGSRSIWCFVMPWIQRQGQHDVWPLLLLGHDKTWYHVRDNKMHKQCHHQIYSYLLTNSQSPCSGCGWICNYSAGTTNQTSASFTNKVPRGYQFVFLSCFYQTLSGIHHNHQ